MLAKSIKRMTIKELSKIKPAQFDSKEEVKS
jgi:hypothetical protein